jgi:hypothetical protein
VAKKIAREEHKYYRDFVDLVRGFCAVRQEEKELAECAKRARARRETSPHVPRRSSWGMTVVDGRWEMC